MAIIYPPTFCGDCGCPPRMHYGTVCDSKCYTDYYWYYTEETFMVSESQLDGYGPPGTDTGWDRFGDCYQMKVIVGNTPVTDEYQCCAMGEQY